MGRSTPEGILIGQVDASRRELRGFVYSAGFLRGG